MFRSLNRFIFLFTFISFVIFSTIAWYIYRESNNTLRHSFESFLYKEVDELALLVHDQESRSDKSMLYRLKMLDYLLYDHPFDTSSTVEQMFIIDIFRGEEYVENINIWLFNGKPINSDIIKYFKIFAEGDIAILQKTPRGFVIIETDFKPFIRPNGKLFFPNNSDLVYYMKNKDFYISYFNFAGRKYKIGVLPIYINGEVKGALMVILSHWFSSDFQTYFQSKLYFKRGFPVLIDEEGNLILHPSLRGQNIENTKVFYKIFLNRNAEEVVKIEYRWPEGITGEPKLFFYKYLPDLGYYVGISIFKKDITAYTRRLRTAFVLAVVISTALVFIFLLLFYLIVNSRLENIRQRLELLAQGRIPERSPLTQTATFDLDELINRIIDNYENIAQITENLSRQNYQIEIKPINPEDVVRINLLNLKNSLLKAQEEQLRHQEQERIRAWRNIGVEKFISLLSLRGRELNQWAFQVLKTAVDYVGGFQGGFFLLEEDEESGEEYFNLISCYAFNEEKIVRRRFHVTVGIFAKIYKDPKLLYIENIPEDYLVITTALGEVKPKSLVLVPLIFDNKLIGVIEIDFAQTVEQYKLDFLDEIAGHISSSLSSWRVEQETKRLLQRYERQSKLLKEKEEQLKEKIQQLKELNQDYNKLATEYKAFKNLVDSFAFRAELDERGKILSVNQRIVNTYKRSYEYFIGRNLRDFSSFDLLDPEHKRNWQNVLKGGIFKFIESIEIDGKTYWIHHFFTGVRLEQDQPVKVLYIGLDVTENKLLERQLRSQVKEITKETRLLRREERRLRKEREEFEKTKQHYEFLLKIYDSTVGQLVLSPSGIITKANRLILEALDYELETLTNRYFSEIIIRADHAKFDSVWTQVKAGEHVVEDFQFLRRDGNALAFTAHFFPKTENNKLLEVYVLLIQ